MGSTSKQKPRTRATKATSSPVFVEGSTKKVPFLRQGTTWAGILSIGAAIATGGVSVFTDPQILAQIGAGVALLIAEN